MIASNLFKYVVGFRKDYENERLVATMVSEGKGLSKKSDHMEWIVW